MGTATLKRVIQQVWTIQTNDFRSRAMASMSGKKLPAAKFRMKDNSPFVFAGLWEGWKDPANGEWIHTCTIIREPNEFVRQIHTRMPVILPEEHQSGVVTW